MGGLPGPLLEDNLAVDQDAQAIVAKGAEGVAARLREVELGLGHNAEWLPAQALLEFAVTAEGVAPTIDFAAGQGFKSLGPPALKIRPWISARAPGKPGRFPSGARQGIATPGAGDGQGPGGGIPGCEV